ncbi:MAG: superoxide dismutase [Arcobacteraceae bacterium]|nr:superoxide dismutase [Arcobacteraceae bacterium]
MKHELMNLPYALDALEPYMSKETMEFHYGKHHQTYVNKLNELIENTEFENLNLHDIIKKADGTIFNNAAQVFNHDFFWHCLIPNQTSLSSELESILIKNFISVDEFKKEFTAKALAHFGSGWTWLIKDERGYLKIISTQNAQTPLTTNSKPLLVCDVWEHAYYIDYRNVRAKYVENFWNIVNWDFVEKNLN